jgi:hypothetical protein
MSCIHCEPCKTKITQAQLSFLERVLIIAVVFLLAQIVYQGHVIREQRAEIHKLVETYCGFKLP